MPTTLPAAPSAPMPPVPSAGGASDDDSHLLTGPQWNLLALAVRQISEHIGQAVGPRVADTMLVQALERAAPRDAFLSGLAVDETGWLRTRQEGFALRFPRYVAAEAIASLLTTYEAACATLLSAERVQELFTTALTPLRASLGQIGLTFSAP